MRHIRSKYQTVVFFISGCLLLLSLTFCKTAQNDPPERDKYRIVNISKFEDCSIYANIIDKGGAYVYRFALSGRCTTLTKELYVEQYTNFLKKYVDSLEFKKGQRIQLDFDRERGIDKNTIEKIASVTKDLIKRPVDVYRIVEDPGIATLEIR